MKKLLTIFAFCFSLVAFASGSFDSPDFDQNQNEMVCQFQVDDAVLAFEAELVISNNESIVDFNCYNCPWVPVVMTDTKFQIWEIWHAYTFHNLNYLNKPQSEIALGYRIKGKPFGNTLFKSPIMDCTHNLNQVGIANFTT